MFRSNIAFTDLTVNSACDELFPGVEDVDAQATHQLRAALDAFEEGVFEHSNRAPHAAASGPPQNADGGKGRRRTRREQAYANRIPEDRQFFRPVEVQAAEWAAFKPHLWLRGRQIRSADSAGISQQQRQDHHYDALPGGSQLLPPPPTTAVATAAAAATAAAGTVSPAPTAAPAAAAAAAVAAGPSTSAEVAPSGASELVVVGTAIRLVPRPPGYEADEEIIAASGDDEEVFVVQHDEWEAHVPQHLRRRRGRPRDEKAVAIGLPPVEPRSAILYDIAEMLLPEVWAQLLPRLEPVLTRLAAERRDKPASRTASSAFRDGRSRGGGGGGFGAGVFGGGEFEIITFSSEGEEEAASGDGLVGGSGGFGLGFGMERGPGGGWPGGSGSGGEDFGGGYDNRAYGDHGGMGEFGVERASGGGGRGRGPPSFFGSGGDGDGVGGGLADYDSYDSEAELYGNRGGGMAAGAPPLPGDESPPLSSPDQLDPQWRVSAAHHTTGGCGAASNSGGHSGSRAPSTDSPPGLPWDHRTPPDAASPPPSVQRSGPTTVPPVIVPPPPPQPPLSAASPPAAVHPAAAAAAAAAPGASPSGLPALPLVAPQTQGSQRNPPTAHSLSSHPPPEAAYPVPHPSSLAAPPQPQLGSLLTGAGPTAFQLHLQQNPHLQPQLHHQLQGGCTPAEAAAAPPLAGPGLGPLGSPRHPPGSGSPVGLAAAHQPHHPRQPQLQLQLHEHQLLALMPQPGSVSPSWRLGQQQQHQPQPLLGRIASSGQGTAAGPGLAGMGGGSGGGGGTGGGTGGGGGWPGSSSVLSGLQACQSSSSIGSGALEVSGGGVPGIAGGGGGSGGGSDRAVSRSGATAPLHYHHQQHHGATTAHGPFFTQSQSQTAARSPVAALSQYSRFLAGAPPGAATAGGFSGGGSSGGTGGGAVGERAGPLSASTSFTSLPPPASHAQVSLAAAAAAAGSGARRATVLTGGSGSQAVHLVPLAAVATATTGTGVSAGPRGSTTFPPALGAGGGSPFSALVRDAQQRPRRQQQQQRRRQQKQQQQHQQQQVSRSSSQHQGHLPPPQQQLHPGLAPQEQHQHQQQHQKQNYQQRQQHTHHHHKVGGIAPTFVRAGSGSFRNGLSNSRSGALSGSTSPVRFAAQTATAAATAATAAPSSQISALVGAVSLRRSVDSALVRGRSSLNGGMELPAAQASFNGSPALPGAGISGGGAAPAGSWRPTHVNSWSSPLRRGSSTQAPLPLPHQPHQLSQPPSSSLPAPHPHLAASSGATAGAAGGASGHPPGSSGGPSSSPGPGSGSGGSPVGTRLPALVALTRSSTLNSQTGG